MFHNGHNALFLVCFIFVFCLICPKDIVSEMCGMSTFSLAMLVSLIYDLFLALVQSQIISHEVHYGAIEDQWRDQRLMNLYLEVNRKFLWGFWGLFLPFRLFISSICYQFSSCSYSTSKEIGYIAMDIKSLNIAPVTETKICLKMI